MTPQVITIERHILDQQRKFPHATGTFTALMYDIALAAKLIARETTRAGLVDILGTAGSTNVQGEEQQKLDIHAHHTIIRMLDHTGRVCVMASEEDPDPIHIPEQYDCGPYVLLFDPLDGSSNINYNVSIGTIFSIFRRITPSGGPGTMEDLLQAGSKMIAAGYVVYGSSTMLVYSAGNGVHGFTLDPMVGEFFLSHPNITMPDDPRYYSVNTGYERFWPEGIKRFVEWVTGQSAEDPYKGLSMRYVGSMVADVHRTLMGGGIFMYPADARDPEKPFGKLRLMYECAPIAFLIEQAGGYASTGAGSVLDIQPYGLHQRAPLLVGNTNLVQKAEWFLQQHNPEWVEAYRQHLRETSPAAAP